MNDFHAKDGLSGTAVLEQSLDSTLEVTSDHGHTHHDHHRHGDHCSDNGGLEDNVAQLQEALGRKYSGKVNPSFEQHEEQYRQEMAATWSELRDSYVLGVPQGIDDIVRDVLKFPTTRTLGTTSILQQVQDSHLAQKTAYAFSRVGESLSNLADNIVDLPKNLRKLTEPKIRYKWGDKKKAFAHEFDHNLGVEMACLGMCAGGEYSGEVVAYYAGLGPEGMAVAGFFTGITVGFAYVLSKFWNPSDKRTAFRDAAIAAGSAEGSCVVTGALLAATLNYHFANYLGIDLDPLTRESMTLHAVDYALALIPANMAMSASTYLLKRKGQKLFTQGPDKNEISMNPNSKDGTFTLEEALDLVNQAESSERDSTQYIVVSSPVAHSFGDKEVYMIVGGDGSSNDGRKLIQYREHQLNQVATYLRHHLLSDLAVETTPYNLQIQAKNGQAVELRAMKLSGTAEMLNATPGIDMQWEVYSQQAPFADGIMHPTEHLFEHVFKDLGIGYRHIATASCTHKDHSH